MYQGQNIAECDMFTYSDNFFEFIKVNGELLKSGS